MSQQGEVMRHWRHPWLQLCTINQDMQQPRLGGSTAAAATGVA